ncbi:MAG TPA: DUF5723 family protein, partial [Bacteroidia bacterium]|nr:DUF5723 family protein [Bacteroidia bacterium]
MSSAFKLTTFFCSLFFIPVSIAAQDAGNDTGAYGTFNNFDRFNSFYLHPMGSHFSGRMLSADFSLVYSSNAAVNSVAYDFYLKQPLDGDDVNTMVGKLSEINIGGRENNYGINFVAPLKKYNHFFTVGYNYRRHQSTRFSGEFGQFFFKGNKQFAGKEIYADETHYLSTRYDALKAGWLHYFSIKGKRAIISLDAGIARGFEYRTFDVKKGRLFTQENGEYLEVTLNMEARRSRYVPLRPFEYSGLGALANAEFSMMLTEKSGFSVKVSDIGFISWDKQSLSYDRSDTTIRFEGVVVPDFDSLGSENYTRQLGDSLINLFKIPYQFSGFSAML